MRLKKLRNRFKRTSSKLSYKRIKKLRVEWQVQQLVMIKLVLLA